MAGTRLNTIQQFLATIAEDPATDAQLHARFLTEREEAAFAEIVRRHGPMVWGVCRNLLPNEADADDAFQATFLALVRGAKSIRKPETLGAWLHGVAVRVANKLKRSASRRTTHERKAATSEADSPVGDLQWDAMLAAVHEEVNRLPEGERTAFVLCVLEGVRQPVAAERLGWKPGTLTGRLSKAKQRLLERLTKRGLTPVGALGAIGLGTTATSAIVPSSLVGAVNGFATNAGAVPASILYLSQGVLGMTITKTKLLAAAVLIAGGLVTGIGASLFSNAEAHAPAAAPAVPAPAAAPPRVTPSGRIPGMPSPLTPVPAGPVVVSHQIWEYKFIEITVVSTVELKKTITDEGKQGWEFVAIDRQAQLSGSALRASTAIFKRPAVAIASRPTVGGVASADVAFPMFFKTLVDLSGGKDVIDIDKLPQEWKDRQAEHVKRAGAGAPEFPKTGKMTYEQFSEWMMAVAKTSYSNKTQSRGGANPFRDSNALETPMGPASADPFNLILPLNAPAAKPSSTNLPTVSKIVAPPAKAALTLRTITAKYSRCENMAKVLKELIAIDEFGGEVTAAIADESSNSLVIKASDAGWKRVSELVRELDERALNKQVEEKKLEETRRRFEPQKP